MSPGVRARWRGTALAVFLMAALWLALGAFRARREEPGRVAIQRASIEAWSAYDGYLESRTVRNIMARLGGSATLVELVAEGASVREGDVLVRLDSSQFDRQLLQLERDAQLAASDLDSLENAKLPLELRDLEMRSLEAQTQLSAEEQFLADTRQLLAEGLAAEMEVRQQEQKVDNLRLLAGNLSNQIELTRGYLHPSQLERARTTLKSAQRELDLVRQQIEDCTIRAPAAGLVVYKPVHVGGEFRTIRVGDTVYRNQPFMALPDMSNLVAHLDVPESELSNVTAGQTVWVMPKAFPGLRLAGRVDNVAAMAQSRMDRPSWQKYFHVEVSLNENDPRLRTGMTVVCNVLAISETNVLVIPRRAVHWDQNQPYGEVVEGRRRTKTWLKLGPGDEQRFIVLDGVAEGAMVVEK